MSKHGKFSNFCFFTVKKLYGFIVQLNECFPRHLILIFPEYPLNPDGTSLIIKIKQTWRNIFKFLILPKILFGGWSFQITCKFAIILNRKKWSFVFKKKKKKNRQNKNNKIKWKIFFFEAFEKKLEISYPFIAIQTLIQQVN